MEENEPYLPQQLESERQRFEEIEKAKIIKFPAAVKQAENRRRRGILRNFKPTSKAKVSFEGKKIPLSSIHEILPWRSHRKIRCVNQNCEHDDDFVLKPQWEIAQLSKIEVLGNMSVMDLNELRNRLSRGSEMYFCTYCEGTYWRDQMSSGNHDWWFADRERVEEVRKRT